MKPLKSVVFFIVLITLYTCKEEVKQDVKTNNLSQYMQVSEIENLACTASSSWFTMVDGVRKIPASKEGMTSVFANNATVTNCNFHQWSRQKFLWLTNEYNGRPLFLDSLHQVSTLGEKYLKGKRIVLVDTAQSTNALDVLKTLFFFR
ncbi:hypothetical protein [Lacinutrix sp. MEBiC02595]